MRQNIEKQFCYWKLLMRKLETLLKGKSNLPSVIQRNRSVGLQHGSIISEIASLYSFIFRMEMPFQQQCGYYLALINSYLFVPIDDFVSFYFLITWARHSLKSLYEITDSSVHSTRSSDEIHRRFNSIYKYGGTCSAENTNIFIIKDTKRCVRGNWIFHNRLFVWHWEHRVGNDENVAVGMVRWSGEERSRSESL